MVLAVVVEAEYRSIEASVTALVMVDSAGGWRR